MTPSEGGNRATRKGPALGRLVFLAPGLAALVFGLWAGLGRLGWTATANPDLVAAHGPLMVVGFLATVIGVERAVALGGPWGWVGPALCAAGAGMVAVGIPVGAVVAASGRIGLLVTFLALARREPTLHTGLMCAGATCCVIGTMGWASGVSVSMAVPWWEAFLVMTIAGERLELGRLQRLSAPARGALVALVALAALLLPATHLGDGAFRALGAAWIAIAAWLGRFDIARRTIRTAGLPRFAGAALLAGYAWLAVGGSAMLAWGHQTAGVRYDAELHAVFVGFTLSMVLGHAPIIFPAVLRVQVPFRPIAWLPLALLHASLLLRVAGDVLGNGAARSAGGVAGVGALLLFLATTAWGFARRGEPVRGRAALPPTTE